MFGAMPKTPLVLEFQITKEYLGFATHLAYLGDDVRGGARAPTRSRKGAGSTRREGHRRDARTAHKLTGMAAVANIGSDRNWCGSHFDQANWYVFGRLAWDPYASARDIAARVGRA